MPSGLRIRLVLAFALAVVSFCSSTLYSNHVSSQIDRGAVAIANEAMPAIEDLGTVRAELRRLDSALSHYAVSRSAVDREDVLSARAAADAAFERYLELPEPSARVEWRELHRALAAVNRAVDVGLTSVGAASPATVASVHPALNAAADTLRLALDGNAARARNLALRIEARRRAAVRVSLLFDFVSTLFTVVAAYLSLRALAHHHRVVEERNRLVAERADELEQFAGRVAHDVLGPLSATRLAVGHATQKVGDGAIRRMLERGLRGVERVSTIVDGLLQFARAGARPQPGVITPVAPVLEALVAEIEPFAQQRGVTLELVAVPACGFNGNAGVLSSVVENLVRNAIKYMGERDPRRVIVRVLVAPDRLRFEIADTGPGIPPSLLPRLFDPHVRGSDTRQPGIGLGLATVKRIVEAHGGRVGVESRLGEGSTFFCELPRADTIDDDHGDVTSPPRSAQS